MMIKSIITAFLPILQLGCASTEIANRCLSYTISGDSVNWRPTKFYQSESSQNLLYIQIPATVAYVPKVEIVDQEFDQPYKIDYTFNNITHQFKVEDNHDEYLLYRETYDGLHKDKVYITCNRSK